MPDAAIRDLVARVDADRIRRDVFRLSSDPLPFRKLNYTIPGHHRSTLDEADDLIAAELTAAGWSVTLEPAQVQAFRCDESKVKEHQYSKPEPDDPWYTAHNVWAHRHGTADTDEIILLCAHKDSQSWVDSPGAYDNAAGTAGVLELARVLADYEPHRSLWLVFCNEEHTPWTSVAAAEGCRERDDNLIAVINCDGLGAKPQQQIDAGLKVHGIRYTVDEGKWLADLMVRMNEDYGIGLTQGVLKRERPGDDDGSFVNAGYTSAIFSGGSIDGHYPDYHRETDTPDKVDVENVAMVAQATIAAVLTLDRGGR